MNFRGELLSVATIMSPPYVNMEYNSSNDTWLLNGGFEAKLLKEMSKYFNFTYKIVNCNRDWGTELPNKTWTGIIGKIVSKIADFGFCGLSITNDRLKVIDFSNPHIITSVSFMTSSPKIEPKITIIMEPFEYPIWICIIIAFVLITFNKWLISQYFIRLKNNCTNTHSLRYHLSRSLLFIGSLKILMCCWLFASLVLLTSYSVGLHSLIAIPSKVKTIDTIIELAEAQKNGRIQVIAPETSYYYNAIKNSRIGITGEIGQLIQPVSDPKTGVEKVLNSPEAYAYIATRNLLTYIMLRFGEKSFHLPAPALDSAIFLDVMAIALQKGFKYKNQFNKFISDITQGGISDYWKLTESKRLSNYNKKNFDNREEENWGPHILSLFHLQSAFYLFFIGTLMSTLVSITELIIK